jgi:hypothetical protein
MNFIPSFIVRMDIYDILYLSYLIPQERLRPEIPDHMRFAVNLENKTIISLVMFHSRNVKASFFPFLGFDYDQANIRTYVFDPVTGKPAVFFLRSGISSPFISAVTRVLGIPWQTISMRLAVENDSDRPYRYSVQGDWGGDFNIDLMEDKDPPAGLQPFLTLQEAALFLTGPTVGFYGSSGILIRFEVRHSVIKPSTGRIKAINIPIIVQSGLLTDEELWSPHNVLVATHAFFSVSMPPTRISL